MGHTRCVWCEAGLCGLNWCSVRCAARLCGSYRLLVWLVLGLGSTLSFISISSQAAVFTCRRLAVVHLAAAQPNFSWDGMQRKTSWDGTQHNASWEGTQSNASWKGTQRNASWEGTQSNASSPDGARNDSTSTVSGTTAECETVISHLF